MRRYLSYSIMLALFAGIAFAADDVASAVVGTVKTVDRGAKTAVVKTARWNRALDSFRRQKGGAWRRSDRQGKQGCD